MTAAQLLQAIAELLRALAWPVTAFALAIIFKPEVRNLLNRLREGAGAKFDPLPQSTARQELLPSTPTGPESVALPFPETPALVAWQRNIQETPPYKALKTDTARRDFLLNTASYFILLSNFVSTEASIFASQLSVLEHLSSRAEGESLSVLRERYYEPARRLYPQLYRDYGLEKYLLWLQGQLMLTMSAEKAAITDQGRDYLVWRAQSRQPPRLHG